MTNIIMDDYTSVLNIILILVTFLVTIYTMTFFSKSYNNKHITGLKNVLFVIAHPDDEAMFFGPTIFNLVHCNKTVNIYLICLSAGSGSSYLTNKRKEELRQSCSEFGLPIGNITIYQHSKLPDGQKIYWSPTIISSIIGKHVHQLNIDTIITFDKGGVSGHPNHIALYTAIKEMKVAGSLTDCQVYFLRSLPKWRKYLKFIDLIASYFKPAHNVFVYIAPTEGVSTIKRAMSRHESQLVWFRKLYLLFSSYIVINQLVKSK